MIFKKYLPLLFLLTVSVLPILDLFHPGLPLTHDGQDHVARIANFYQNLKEGILIPRWAPNLNWGYGHPILMFLYPTSSYLASFFHFVGFSLVDSVKIVFGLTFVLSGVSMYLWAKNQFNNSVGFLVAVLYIFTPYRFVDLYVRGAIGEHTAFVFLPFVLYFLLKISKKYSSWHIVFGSLSFAGLILSHNAISLMFFPIIFLYVFYLFWQAKFEKKLIINVFSIVILGFGLASFFWVPAFFEGKYTLRNIVTKGEYLKRFIILPNLFYGPWSYEGSGRFTVQIGIVNIFAFMTSLFSLRIFFKKKDKIYLFIFGIIIYSLFVIFIMLPQSNFIWQRFMILQNFQFPWRFLSVLVFTTSVFAGFFLKSIPKKFQTIFLILIFSAVILFNKDYWHANTYLYKSETFYSGIYDGTTDTGESAPVWSVRFMEKRAREKIEIIDGKGELKEISRTSIRHEYQLNAQNKVRVRENTLYFPGWNVFVDNKPVTIEFQDQNNRGLITFFAPKGEHNVKIEFKETKRRMMADTITLLSFFSLVLILGMSRFKREFSKAKRKR
ncbi:MAG: 6-pyruvoyl-tetrahydropterin synthase-related protein [Candidatus Levybacteria bacterium]|nr:6-pyruvoyl-tetrahydropterin synthase-related protein [Candidatus Levybacteria bacterium]